MGKINLIGIVAYGYHGVLPAERELGQRFIADVELETDMQQVGSTDDIATGTDYAAVYACVQARLSGTPVRTLERLVTLINADILAHFPLVAAVCTRIHKPSAPIPGALKDITVERRAVRV